jgi:hypothetical protein
MLSSSICITPSFFQAFELRSWHLIADNFGRQMYRFMNWTTSCISYHEHSMLYTYIILTDTINPLSGCKLCGNGPRAHVVTQLSPNLNIPSVQMPLFAQIILVMPNMLLVPANNSKSGGQQSLLMCIKPSFFQAYGVSFF